MTIKIPRLYQIVFLGSLILCRVGVAQTVLEIPSLKPAALAHWTITYQDPEAKKPAAPPPKRKAGDGESIDPETGATKGRHVIKEEYEIGNTVAAAVKTNSDGSTDMIYIVDKVAYLVDSQTQKVRVETVNVNSLAIVRFTQKYPGFDWIGKESFVGEQEKDGHKFLYFKMGATEPPQRYEPKKSSHGREAWIDADSGLPYAFRNGAISGVYQYLPKSDGKIALPPAINKAVRYFKGYDD